MKDLWIKIGVDVLTVVSPLFLAALTLVAMRLNRLIVTRIKNERIQTLLLRLDNAAVNAVKEVEQTFISNLTNAKPEDLVMARNKAIDSIKAHFGSAGILALEKELGLDNAEEVQKLILSTLEARVHDIKALSSIPAGALTGQAATASTEKGL